MNAVAIALVLLLLSLGFEVLKFPSQLVPDRPPLLQFIGFCSLAFLNLVIMWSHARDDFVRRSYGLPRVLGTLLILGILGSLGCLVRGLWDGTYHLNLSAKLDGHDAITVAIGGQIVVALFMSAFFLKKADTSAVREFKRALGRGRSFLAAWLTGRITDAAEFHTRHDAVSNEMGSMAQKADAIDGLVAAAEVDYAREAGSLMARADEYIRDLPESEALGNRCSFVTANKESIKKVMGNRVFKQVEATAAA